VTDGRDSKGPYRDEDPIRKLEGKVDDLIGKTDVFIGEARNADHELRTQIDSVRSDVRSSRLRTIVPWISSPFFLVGIGYILSILVPAGASCSGDNDRQRKALCHEQCAAVGLQYGGFSDIQDEHSGCTSSRCLCGNGHGDGMYVGSDGHFHGMKVTADPKADQTALRCERACSHSHVKRLSVDAQGYPVCECE